MKIAVSPANGRIVPSSSAALSSSRSDVVPTATIRPPFARAAFSAVRGRRGDRPPFGMHAVVGGVVGLDRQERARRRHAASPCGGRRPSHRAARTALGEMQPGGRRRDGALLAREDRLVVAPVGSVLGRGGRRCRAAAARGRSRRSPRRATGPARSKRERHLAGLALLLDRRVEPGDEAGVVVRPRRTGCGRRGEPLRRRAPAPASAMDRARRMSVTLMPAPTPSRDPLAVELGRDHLGVVEDQRVAGRAAGPAGRGRSGRRAPRPARRRAGARRRAAASAGARSAPRAGRNRTGRRACRCLAAFPARRQARRRSATARRRRQALPTPSRIRITGQNLPKSKSKKKTPAQRRQDDADQRRAAHRRR